jgi:hypothetical protein
MTELYCGNDTKPRPIWISNPLNTQIARHFAYLHKICGEERICAGTAPGVKPDALSSRRMHGLLDEDDDAEAIA